MDLRIPHPDDANFPRILRGDEEIAEQLEVLRQWPDETGRHLGMAAGYLLASDMPGAAAAVLVALMTLYPDTDFRT